MSFASTLPARAAAEPMVLPVRYVTLGKFEQLTGYSPDAVHAKIQRGQWLEGRLWKKAPDGRVMVDLVGYSKWVEGESVCPPQPRRR